MRVKFVSNVSAPYTREQQYVSDQEYDLPDDEAKRWIADGTAVSCAPSREPMSAQVETASVAAPEKAVRKRGRPRKAATSDDDK